jgi:hypothetical protein
MSDRWTTWKSFPDDYHGEAVQAPIGPGVYEVCNAATRQQLAFGCTRNLARKLGGILKPRGLRKWLSLRRRRYTTGELEYRVWPTATLSGAKVAMGIIREQRGAMLRRFNAARA